MLNALLTTLNGLTDIPFVELAWTHSPDDKYGVITLNNQIALNADADPVTEKMLSGFVDVFVKKPQDLSTVNDVENALKSLGIWFALESVQFEDDTGYVHYEWQWRDSTGVVTGNLYTVTFYVRDEKIGEQIVSDPSQIDYPTVDNFIDGGLTYSFSEWDEHEQGYAIRCDAVLFVVVSITKSGTNYTAHNNGADFTAEQVQTIIDWYDDGNPVLCVQGTYPATASGVSDSGVSYRPRLFFSDVLASWVVES